MWDLWMGSLHLASIHYLSLDLSYTYISETFKSRLPLPTLICCCVVCTVVMWFLFRYEDAGVHRFVTHVTLCPRYIRLNTRDLHRRALWAFLAVFAIIKWSNKWSNATINQWLWDFPQSVVTILYGVLRGAFLTFCQLFVWRGYANT